MILQRPRGEAAKQAAHILHEATRAQYLLLARRALLLTLLDRGEATIDDVRAEFSLPPGVNPKLFGAVPTLLAKAGIIAHGGYVRTTRDVANGRPVTIWVLTDRAAAERWLDEHPEPDDPGGAQRRLF